MIDAQKCTIGDLIHEGAIIVHKDGNHGSNYPRVNDFGDDGHPFLTAKSLSDWHVDLQGAPRLFKEKASTFKFGFLEAGDVLLSHNATVGRVAIVPKTHEIPVIGTSLTQFRVDPRKLSNRYLALYFSSRDFQNQLSFVMAQTTRNQVPITEQRKLTVILPPLTHQIAIADTAFSLIDKIELNRRMNDMLEAMARAIFKDWFVDFGPTRAKMEGRPPYLAPDIWSLFPERLDDEGKPEGWESAKLGAVTSELRRGVSPKYTTFGGIIVLNQKCIRNRQVDMTPARFHDDAQRDVSDRMIQTGDILVNSTGVGTLGRVAQLWKLHNPMIVDSHVTVVRPNSEQVSRSYLGVALTEREAEIEALGEGSTGQTELSRARLADLDVLIPNLAVQAAFDSLAVPILDRMEANRAESRTLATTRDFLLPKLMSGEVRVKGAEKLVGEAV